MILFPVFMVAAAGLAQAGDANARIEGLLARMTVAEKAGQMTQVNISTVIDGEETPDGPFVLNDDKLRAVVAEAGVGSVFGVWHGPLSVERWREVVSQVQAYAVGETRLGVPVVFADDSVHGANYLIGGTIMPHNLNVAATWDPSIAEEAGYVTAVETRAKATHWTFAPVCDVARQPLWSRVFETFGEDPLLCAEMSSATIRGLQRDGLASHSAVAATAKHFLGYSVPFTGRDRTPAFIGASGLHDVFVPPFRAAFAAGAPTVMINSGEINGVPVHADERVLIDLLRGELGFTGVAVTDWGDVDKLVAEHRVARDKKDAARIAVLAGVDMSMVAQSTDFAENVTALVEEGLLPESRLDEAVRRILRLKSDLGLFEDPIGGHTAVARVGSEEHHEVSMRAARESLVLLRNRGGVLPLAEGSTILVTGPAADSLWALHGAWSYTWQGAEPRWYPDTPTVLDALRERFGAASVAYDEGATWTEARSIDAAARKAAEADAVVLCLGEAPSAERPGDIDSLRLDRAQADLARAVMATGKPVVLVMITNRARVITEIEAGAAAVIWAGHPGPHGSTALAGMLAGDFNPGGRLPFTYPRHEAHLVTYDRKSTEDVGRDFQMGAHDPLFAFGAGEGYAPFSYSDLTVVPEAGGLRVEVTVANAGARRGAEVVQVYATDLVASVTPHASRLKDFRKVELEAGQARREAFGLTREDLSIVDRDGKTVFEPGAFTVRVGGLTATADVE